MQPALNNKPKAGFTLLELIVAMAIFSLIGGVLVMIFVSSVEYFSNEKSQLFNQSSITALSNAFEADTRKASAATVMSGCLVLTINSGNTTYCLNSTTHEVSRNSTVIADQIQTLEFTITLNKLMLTIHSTNDQRGFANTMYLTYYIREGNY